MRFAEFDPRAPQPSPVLGWWDTAEFDYPALPEPAAQLAMTDDEWEGRCQCLWAVDGGRLVPLASARPTVWWVPKVVLVHRLADAGLLRAFRAELRIGKPDTGLDDAELLLRERWEADTGFGCDDAPLRDALARAGADVDDVMRPQGA